MDAYEATRIVFSRIQSLDPENAAKIMGLLLIQDHGEKEMIRLAFGPETLLHSVILKARKELGLLPPSTPTTPSAVSASPFLLARQNSSSRLLNGGVSPSSWAPPPPFSRTNSSNNGNSFVNGVSDDFQNGEELQNLYGGDHINEFQLQDQLSYLNDPVGLPIGPKADDIFYPDPAYGMNWGVNGHQRRSCSFSSDLCLSPDASGAGFGWKPCLYFARGYCKNGSSCRFLHGLPDDAAAAAVEQQCQELLLRSKSQRLMASAAAAFPYSPTGSSSSKCMNFVLQQQQQNESQRAAAAAAAAALMLGGDESHKFVGRARMERSDFAGMMNPGSRQIYLTFPADSTFREEDVSNYFSIYGPVQDVRIPYQQKRMFGFVTFVYPETVRLILAKGNPHFVCDARVLVKPYKEKGKVPDKYRKPQQGERGDFSGCTTPTGLDSRDPYDLQQLASTRMLYGSDNQDVLLRRKMEEQQAAAELQQAIELQGRRFMGLQLLDLKSRSFSSSTAPHLSPLAISTPTITITSLSDGRSSNGSQDESPSEDKSPSPASGAASALSNAAAADKQQTSGSSHGFPRQTAVNVADKEPAAGELSPNEDIHFQESTEHNLPDSPFASPTKSSFVAGSFSMASEVGSLTSNNNDSSSNSHLIASKLLPPTSTLENMASFKSCFFQMPRFSSGHGAVGL